MPKCRTEIKMNKTTHKWDLSIILKSKLLENIIYQN